MPGTKSKNQKTSTGNKSGQTNKTSRKSGMTPGAMPHIPGARERARDIDSSRRSNAQTFEL